MSTGPVTPCARCGVLRTFRHDRGLLCRDCVYVLTVEEKRAWAA